jgi:2-polyprenyl-3-methyl-5-hydroxy-6-metoxy-1,4-benzoquinol methylase
MSDAAPEHDLPQGGPATAAPVTAVPATAVPATAVPATAGSDYTERLQRLELASWKRLLDVQAPYRWNVRRLCPGRVLDVGCGVGRNLAHLGSRAVGVDHNAHSVEVARSRGCAAFTPEQLVTSGNAGPASYDSLLAAHLLEHLAEPEATELLASYLPLVRRGGRVVLITPQERGWRSDATHVRWVGFDELRRTAEALGLQVDAQQSFPFPRPAGRVFRYNEFVQVATVRAAAP